MLCVVEFYIRERLRHLCSSCWSRSATWQVVGVDVTRSVSAFRVVFRQKLRRDRVKRSPLLSSKDLQLPKTRFSIARIRLGESWVGCGAAGACWRYVDACLSSLETCLRLRRSNTCSCKCARCVAQLLRQAVTRERAFDVIDAHVTHLLRSEAPFPLSNPVNDSSARQTMLSVWAREYFTVFTQERNEECRWRHRRSNYATTVRQ